MSSLVHIIAHSLRQAAKVNFPAFARDPDRAKIGADSVGRPRSVVRG
jgi:hypothetical protein